MQDDTEEMPTDAKHIDLSLGDLDALCMASNVVSQVVHPTEILFQQDGVGIIQWLPYFGAAILACPAGGCYPPQSLHLHVVGLDNWEFDTHG